MYVESREQCGSADRRPFLYLNPIVLYKHLPPRSVPVLTCTLPV